MKAGSQKAYHLKITLDGVSPRIWRRFVVPPDISLDRLHDIIQILMDWRDYHVHEFIINGKKYTEDPDCDEDGAEESAFRLSDLVRGRGDVFSYNYDFGDGWKHTLLIEDVQAIPKGYDLRISCVEGKNASPPEDVGGVDGYADFRKKISNPRSREREELIEWAKGNTGQEHPFDPKRFDVERTNIELYKYVRWSRARPLP